MSAARLALLCVLVAGCEAVLGLEDFAQERDRRAMLGEACAVDPLCESGHCVDGVCCEEVCPACMACNVEPGACTPIELGLADPPECAAVCDGKGGCARGEVEWSAAVNGVGDQMGFWIDASEDGIALGGRTTGSTFMGRAATVPSGGAIDGFVALLTPAGEVVWTRQFGAPGETHVDGVAIGADGVVAVGVAGALVIDVVNEPVNGTNQAFVLELAPSGEAVWGKLFGGPSYDRVHAVAVGEAGAITIAGISREAPVQPKAVDYGCDDEPGEPLSDDLFVMRLDAAGNCDWSYTDPAPGIQEVGALALTADGGAVVVGHTAGNLTSPGGDGHVAGNDGYVLRLDARGEALWARLLVGSGNTNAWAVAVDSQERIFAGGSFTGDLAAAGDLRPPLVAPGNPSAYLAVFSGDGELESLEAYGNATATVNSLSVDAADNLLVAGAFTGSIERPGIVLASHQPTVMDAFALKLAADGTSLWGQRLGGSADLDTIWSIAAGPNGPVASGHFAGTTTLGDHEHQSAGGQDGFVLKLSP